jgi:cytochrome P450
MTVEDTSLKLPLTTHEVLSDPYGGFSRLREETRIARAMWDGGPAWFITRYDDVNAVLQDRRFATNYRSAGGIDTYADVLIQLGISPEHVPYLADSLVYTDAPDHTRLRKLVIRAFSARRIAALRSRMQEITEELIDALPGHADDGVVDLIEHFAKPLPITVICELIGVPVEDRDKWRAWNVDYSSKDPKRLNTMLGGLSAYLHDLSERRRAEPAGDLLTVLTQRHDEDEDILSDTELVTMVLTLMIAAVETTPPVIGTAVMALLTHPDQLALVREDPSLLPAAVQEVIRWCGPAVVSKIRYATEDIMIGDTLIKKRDRVQVVLGAANHDPRRYPDPERFDITRRLDTTGVQHFGYSRGPHYCLGAGLANQEIEIALKALLDRYPDLALGVPADRVEWKRQPVTRQLARLPVILGKPG